MIALLDNTVMSNFAAIERPDLLRTAFSSGLATSQQAFDELQARYAAGQVARTRLVMAAGMDG